MKEIKNCRKCGVLFSSEDKGVLCKRCSVEEGEVIREIKDYLYKNPGTSVYELSMKFNISVARIQSYILSGEFKTF